jgi:hypothetical protein
MVWIGRWHAQQIRAFLGTSGPLTGEALCAAIGIPLHPLPPIGRVPGIYAGDYIAVRRDIAPSYREHTIFHEVGHHLIHGPIGGYPYWKVRDPVMNRRQYRQAQDFAYFAALPGDVLTLLLSDGLTAWEIGRIYGRSRRWMVRRIELADRAGELEPIRRQIWMPGE